MYYTPGEMSARTDRAGAMCLLKTQVELVRFWNDHVTLSGNLPNLCLADSENTGERFQYVAAVLKTSI